MCCISWLWGCTAKHNNPLLGNWQSNEMETLKEIRRCGAYTENQIELIQDIHTDHAGDLYANVLGDPLRGQPE